MTLTFQLAETLGTLLITKQWKLATAESCTGGGLAYSLTEIPGSSAWFDRGLVTYSNLAKQELLAVKSSTLQACGAVSESTAREMAEGILWHSQAQLGIAITGVAGPEGGSLEKPVGTVWFAWGKNHAIQSQLYTLSGNRQAIREQSIQIALIKLINFLS